MQSIPEDDDFVFENNGPEEVKEISEPQAEKTVAPEQLEQQFKVPEGKNKLEK